MNPACTQQGPCDISFCPASKKVRAQKAAVRSGAVAKVPGTSSIVIDQLRHEFTVHDQRHPAHRQIENYLATLWQQMKAAGFQPRTDTVMHNFSDEEEKESHLCQHSEKLAIAYGLMNTPPGTTLTIINNLRVCPDCHEATRFISLLTKRTIKVRDANSWHYFHEGSCSCKEYW